MRTINVNTITENIKEMCIQANHFLADDMDKAITREAGSHSGTAWVKDLEEEMLETINKLGIGPGGLGGTTTALAVNVNTYPTHIAGLPVAVNICCHVNRHIIREV